MRKGTPGRPLDKPPVLVVVVEFLEETPGAAPRLVQCLSHIGILLIKTFLIAVLRTRTTDLLDQPVVKRRRTVVEAAEELYLSAPMPVSLTSLR